MRNENWIQTMAREICAIEKFKEELKDTKDDKK
jgi:hypothetical protein